MSRFCAARLVPPGLFLLNFIVGLLFINEGLFHMDSVALAMAVEHTYQTGILQPAVLGRYGAVAINSLLYWPFHLLGQNAELATRISSVLFHSLSVVAFYYLIRNLFRDGVQAFFGALLLSFTPLYFNPNTYGKEHGMGIFLLLTSFIILHRGVEKDSPLTLALASLCYVLSIAVRESQLSTLLLFILLFLNPAIGWRPFKIIMPLKRFSAVKLIAFFVPLLIPLAVMAWGYLLQSARGAELTSILSPTLLPALSDLQMSMPFLVFVFMLLGIWNMARSGALFLTLFFLLWLLLILVHGCTKWYAVRFLDVVLIPIYVFASYPLAKLYPRSKVLISSLVIYCVASMFLYSYPMLAFRHRYNGEKRLAEYVKFRTEPDALIITVNQFPFIQYYGQRQTAWLPINGSPEAINIFINKVEGHLKEGKPVYYTDSPYLKGYEASSLYTIQQYYRIKLIGGILIEDYLRPELRFRFAYQKLYKVSHR